MLFFLTSEFPYGQGETFVENEISFLAAAFDDIVIVPLRKPVDVARLVPDNACVEQAHSYPTGWIEVLWKIVTEKEIATEFLKNAISNPLKNKILLSTLRNSLGIAKNLKELQKKYPSPHRLYYSYWLDDGTIAMAFLNGGDSKISRAHGWDIYFERHACNYLPLRKFLTNKLDKIFTVSENGKSYIVQKTARSEKIAVARLGTFNSTPFNNSADTSALTVITLSSAIPLKRIHLVGEAVHSINNPHIRWNHFGDGPLLDQIKREFPFAVFHGHVNNEEIKGYLERLAPGAVLVNTSTNEGIPVSMMEAMSFGIPCIGTNVGGVAEIIEDGVNGFLMPKNPTGEVVAEYIQKYAALPQEEQERMRANAFERWNKDFNAAKNYRRFVDEIKSMK
jgi:glycosyltransferase involved in cell wall biosynthesis